jgi:hypothetical protein
MIFEGYVFDIERTQVDRVPQALGSLHDTLREWGYPFPMRSCSSTEGSMAMKNIAPSLTVGGGQGRAL